MLIRRLIRHVYRRPADEGGDLGGAPAAPAAEVAAAPAAPAADAAQPASMHDAMWHRDEAGRFAPKPADVAQGAQPAASPGAQPAVQGAQPSAAQQPAAAKPADPAAPEDITAMPDGLGAKAQERFQKLANGIKERDQQIEQLGAQVTYVQQQFQRHGVSQPQFEQALGVIGALNRGDYRSALAALDEQRRQIALQLGEPLPGVDALAGFPDLRQQVDQLHMTEAAALEIARFRQQGQQQQQARQIAQQQQDAAQQHQQAVNTAQQQVDQLCKRLQASDIDFPAIEAMLLPEIPNLLQGIPPAQWSRVVETQYRLIKNSGVAFRRPPPAGAAGAPAPAPLRPTGQGGVMPRPSSMFEAMWNRAPSGA